jgi:hypothetical protein
MEEEEQENENELLEHEEENGEQLEDQENEIIENPRKETREEKLAKANRKIYKWMAGIQPNEIGGTIGDWDKVSLLKMVKMADQEIREHPQKFILIILHLLFMLILDSICGFLG